jgi:hypothetical protein
MSGGNPMMEYLKDKWVVLVYLFFYIYGFISFLKDLGLLIPQMVQ